MASPRSTGWTTALASEMLEFPNGVMGMALNLEEDTVGAVILGDASAIKEGDQVRTHRPRRRGAGGRGAAGPRGRPAGPARSTARAPIPHDQDPAGRAHRARA